MAETNFIDTRFIDSPEPEQLKAAITCWQKPALAENLKETAKANGQEDFWVLGRCFQENLEQLSNLRLKHNLEKSVLDWLSDLVRLNIKRGRIFDLREVLKTGKADCLGYAKVFTVLGRYCGLDLGIVEVVIDNRGRNVPHTATLVRLSNDRRQFVDFWYGNKNIRHRRLGLSVKRDGEWRVEDLDFGTIKEAEEISYLPDYCVDAITLYIEGNRSLKRHNYVKAIAQYSQAAGLYPLNARVFYNRAIAYENLGEKEKAQADYARALQDKSAEIRTLATQPEDIVDLIQLDEKNIPEQSQNVLLLYTGFVTGKKFSPSQIAQKLGLTTAEVRSILKLGKASSFLNIQYSSMIHNCHHI